MNAAQQAIEAATQKVVAIETKIAATKALITNYVAQAAEAETPREEERLNQRAEWERRALDNQTVRFMFAVSRKLEKEAIAADEAA